MKKSIILLLLSVVAMVAANGVYAQFSRLVQMSQAQQAISSFSYKGFVDVGYMAGVGHYSANKFEATTSHGLSSGNLFMGIGAGIDVLKTDDDGRDSRWNESLDDFSDNAYMIPIFFDFRYSGSGAIGMFVDFKAGISLLTGDSYITINDGVFDNDVSFYLNCSLGVRFALGAKSAFNVGLTYSLISQRYYGYDDYYYHSRYDGISLHGLGVTAGIEW